MRARVESQTGPNVEPSVGSNGESLSRPVAPAAPLLVAAAFATIYVIWGSTYLAIRVGVETLPPFFLAASRFLLAGGLLYGGLRASGAAARPRAGDWKRAAVGGLLMLAVGSGLVTWAQQRRVPSGTAALLVAAVPLWMALIEWARPGGSRPTRSVMFGIALGAMGLLLLVKPSGHADPAAEALVPTLAILLSGIAWAAGTMYARYAVGPANGPLISAQQMLIAGAALLIVSAVGGELRSLSVAHVSARSAFALSYLTVFGSLVGFSAYGYLVRVSTPARLSTTAYVNPIVAVVLGWALLGERLSARAMVGAAILLCAVLVMTTASVASARRERAAARRGGT